MKKLLLTFVVMLPMVASAQPNTVTVDGICYELWNNEAAVYNNSEYGRGTASYTGNVVIPPTVTTGGKTYNVTTIGSGAFSGSSISSVSIPSSECALIAATLPNPRKYSSKSPSAYMLKRQSRILREMKFVGEFPTK